MERRAERQSSEAAPQRFWFAFTSENQRLMMWVHDKTDAYRTLGHISLVGKQMTEGKTILEARNIYKSYDGVDALRGVSFELRAGEVHALIGENGAGKSTLIKIFTGAIQADAGEVEFDGKLITSDSPAHAKSIGIAAIYQQPALFPELTVAENISIGLEAAGAWRKIDWRKRRTRASQLLSQVGARIDPDSEVRSLSMPEQQLVEIARALGA